MCFFSKPNIPQPKEPKLPKQPLQTQKPANLSVGRGAGDRGTDTMSRNRSRRKLRIMRDTSSVQSTGSVGPSSGVNISG